MNLRQILTRNSVQIMNLRHDDKFSANNAFRTNFDRNFGASPSSNITVQTLRITYKYKIQQRRSHINLFRLREERKAW